VGDLVLPLFLGSGNAHGRGSVGIHRVKALWGGDLVHVVDIDAEYLGKVATVPLVKVVPRGHEVIMDLAFPDVGFPKVTVRWFEKVRNVRSKFAGKEPTLQDLRLTSKVCGVHDALGASDAKTTMTEGKSHRVPSRSVVLKHVSKSRNLAECSEHE